MSNTSNRKGLVGKVDIIQIDYSQNVGSDEIIFMNKDHLKAYTDKARIDELERLYEHTRNVATKITGNDNEVYHEDTLVFISRYEVQERLDQLKGDK